MNVSFQKPMNKNLKLLDLIFLIKDSINLRFFHNLPYEVKYGSATGLLCHYIANDPQSLSSKHNNYDGNCDAFMCFDVGFARVNFLPSHALMSCFLLKITTFCFCSYLREVITDLYAVTHRLS